MAPAAARGKAKEAVAEEVQEDHDSPGPVSVPLDDANPPPPHTNGSLPPTNGAKGGEDIGIDNSGIVGEGHSHLPQSGRSGRPRNSPALMFLEHAKRVWKFTDHDSKLTQGN